VWEEWTSGGGGASLMFGCKEKNEAFKILDDRMRRGKNSGGKDGRTETETSLEKWVRKKRYHRHHTRKVR